MRATPNPLDITANLRAPLVIRDGRGYQVINASEDAPLQAPLFELPPSRPPSRRARATPPELRTTPPWRLRAARAPIISAIAS